MNRLFPPPARRRFLQTLAGGLAAALAAEWIEPRFASAGAPPVKAKVRPAACIVLWMNGGPSHLDTFDPKPGSSGGGPFKAIGTRAKGVRVCQHLPQVAEQAHHLALLRGISSKEGNHDRARYLLHTGYAPNPTVIHPSLGGWASSELGGAGGDLPAFISLGGPSMSAGFLGAQHGPFVIQGAVQQPANVALPRGVDEARFDRRRAALEKMEAHFTAESNDAKIAGRRGVYEAAIRMMKSPNLAAFDLSSEPAAAVKAYGDTDFGRRCLVARRLIESGVRLVEVTLDGWDTHQDNFTRVQKLLGTLDPAMAALIKDLDQRGLLSRTLVVWAGDFGRTPKINPNDGRDHHPGAWTAALAGCGIRGGVAYGQTDADGEKVVDKPIAVPDLFTTLVTQLGMDPDKSFPTPSGRPISITEGGKVLREILT